MKFSVPDIYKFFLGVLGLAGFWYDLKTDLAVHIKSHELIEYRLAAIEKALLASNTYRAILPKETKLENEY